MRQLLPNVTKRADIVALLDEWATRFFEELDYVKEGQNATRFAELMKVDLPQVGRRWEMRREVGWCWK